MAVETKKGDGDNELVISISGKFDFNSVQDFRNAYAGGASYKKYRIDMTRVDHIDSSALGMLLNMQKHVGQASITIANCNPQIKKIFMISRFDKKFDFA